MSLIEFQDLPNTDTPINAENLNYNFSHIVESGENENGKWVKWADGTMIITQKVTNNARVEVADGNLYRGNVGSLPDFPVEFIEPPVVNLTLTNAFKLILSGQEGTPTTKRAFEINGVVPNIGVHSASSVNKENVIINVTATGKWK